MASNFSAKIIVTDNYGSGAKHFLDSTDLNVPITYQIADVRNIAKRNSAYSKTIKLPGTKNNNKIFTNIFDVNASLQFNPAKRANCVVLSDELPVLYGFLQLLAIDMIDQGEIVYEVVLYGEFADLAFSCGDNLLTGTQSVDGTYDISKDLDMSDLNHLPTKAIVEDSWVGDSDHLGFIYPHIDYGDGWNNIDETLLTPPGTNTNRIQDYAGHIEPLINFQPAIYLKRVWDKIFQKYKFTYTSDFINGLSHDGIFKKLFITPNLDSENIVQKNKLFSYKWDAGESQTLYEADDIAYRDSSFFNVQQSDGNVYWQIDGGLTHGYGGSPQKLGFTSGTGGAQGDVFQQFFAAKSGVTYSVSLNYDTLGAGGSGGNYKIEFFWGEKDGTTRHYQNVINTTTGTTTLGNTTWSGTFTPTEDAYFIGFRVTIAAYSGGSSPNINLYSVGYAYNPTTSQHQIIEAPTKIYDIGDTSTNYYNVSNGQFTVPQDGLYNLNLNFIVDGLESDKTKRLDLRIYNVTDSTYLVSNPSDGGPTGWNISSTVSGQIIQSVNSSVIPFAFEVDASLPKVNINGLWELHTGKSYRLEYMIMPLYYAPATSWSVPGHPSPSGGRVDYSTAVIAQGSTIELTKASVTNNMALYLPDGMRQIDFIMSIAKMFNLYFAPDPEYSRNLIIEPRDDYYKKGAIKDWSTKLDRSSDSRIQLLAELAGKNYKFDYTSDSDYLNKLYKDKYFKDFGQYGVSIDNDFIYTEFDIVPAFAPTLFEQVPGFNNFVVPGIFSQDQSNTRSRVTSKPRVLINTGVNITLLTDSVNTGADNLVYKFYDQTSSTSHRTYRFTGMYDSVVVDNVNNVNKVSLSYGPVNSLDVYNTDSNGLKIIKYNTLYDLYWANWIKTISNPLSKTMRVKFWLNSQDIYNFRFNDKIYLVIEGSPSYWYVNQIIDYNPVLPDVTEVELIQVI